jgi:hypothetical protein
MLLLPLLLFLGATTAGLALADPDAQCCMAAPVFIEVRGVEVGRVVVVLPSVLFSEREPCPLGGGRDNIASGYDLDTAAFAQGRPGHTAIRTPFVVIIDGDRPRVI